ncbi:MAG: DUF58 domain-containing protein [Haliscomenobacteraceae bacterium CHB4]|nr:hypothetical protein [Saprospiraceae bacterium]MCE7924638.1 DUF58 domain-containing protein [Haliscomenobacteraceae bacterium CHB4]
MSQILESQDIRALGSNLELLAHQVVEGFIVGLHRSPFHGFSVEFAEHRLYNVGESTRNIDWKVYGRTDKLFTKKFEEETNLRCQIVLDASSTMYYPWDEKNPEKLKYKNKFCFAAQSAAVLMNALRRQRDAFGLTLFDDEIRLNTQAKSNTVHYRMLLSQLAQRIENPELNRPTNLAAILHQVAEAIHRRSLVVIFTDVMEQPDQAEEIFAALQHLRYAKHEVILFHVTDKSKELDFEFENRPYVFVDMESGEQVKLQPNQVKEYYVKQVAAFTEQLKLRCLQYKIDFVEADINKGFHQILQTWMMKRAKMG